MSSEKNREHEMVLREAMEWVGEMIVNKLREAEELMRIYTPMVEYLDGVPSGERSVDLITVEEIEKCRNQREGMRYAAELNGGRVRVREVARLIHASSLSNGTLSSVRSALLRHAKESDEWQEEDGGWFRLLSFDRLDRPERSGTLSSPGTVMKVASKAKDIRRQAEAVGLVPPAVDPTLGLVDQDVELPDDGPDDAARKDFE